MSFSIKSRRAQQLSNESYRRTFAIEDPQREKIYRAVARGEIDIRYATESAEAWRWGDRAPRHLSRICYYLNLARN